MISRALTRLLVIGAVLSGCAADPDDDGACTLSCSNPRVASAQFTVQPMVPDDLAEEGIPVYCPGAAATETEGPVMVQFRVFEKRTRFGYPDSHPSGDEGGGGGAGGAGGAGEGFLMQEGDGDNPLLEPILEPRMIGGVAFQPVVYGRMSAARTNDEHKDGANGATPWKFAGIVTPSSEWCSDSCGVMTYEFWPSCSGETVEAGVAVQGIKSERFVTFSLENGG